jgi:vancomycin resistance protein YoaR
VIERAPAQVHEQAPGWPSAVATAGRRSRLLGMPRPLLAVALALVLVLGLVGVDTALAAGGVRRGVSVGGIALGGLSTAAARARLAAAAVQVEARPLALRADTARVELPRSEAGVRLDVEGSLAAALAVGRSGPFGLGRLRSWFGGVELPWKVRLERQGVQQAVARLDAQIRRPIREPALRLTGTKVELVQGTPGRGVDPAGAPRALEAAAGLPAGAEVALPVSEQRPTVDQEAAQAAAAQVRKLLSGPLTVTAAGHSASLQPRELAARVRGHVRSGRLVVELVPAALDGLLRQRAAFAYTAPRDARFQPSGRHVRLLPAVTGSVVDAAKAAAALLAAGGKDGGERTAALPVHTTDPKLTTAAARALGVEEVISSFTTTFSSSDAPRVHNISLIAAAVDGQLVPPGQVFSMNAATGERTPGKGYRTAKVIKDGEIVPGLGGGVCQAGTTMFNAVFFAGLPVIERRNHSLHISHYPMGRDATLNWPSTDLKFRNDSPYGVYVTARATSATMNVTLWSTSRGYDVAFSTSAPYNFRSPPTKFEDDPTLPVGQQVVESNGSAGFDVTVHRTVTHDGQVVRKDSFVSNYVPWSKVVRRGTKPPGPPQPGPPPGSGA